MTSLTLAHVFEPRVSKSFMSSYIKLRDYEKERGTDISELELPGTINSIGRCRNQIVSWFLETTSEWLMWLDTDMGFRPDSAEKLISKADPIERPVVGGLYFGLGHGFSDGMGGFLQTAWPQIYMEDEEGVIAPVTEIPDHDETGLVKCDFTGSGFIVIHRVVFEKGLEDSKGDWYTLPVGYQQSGEDSYFCERLRLAKIPLYVDVLTQATHHKDIWISSNHWRMKSASG